MRRCLLTAFLLSLFSISVFSQNDWRSGYIIKNGGDTLHGFIDYRSFKKNARSCYFRISKEADKIKFTPNDISGYRIDNGAFYVSKAIYPDSLFFLEFLVQGKANLYSLNLNEERFFIEKDGIIKELTNTVETEQTGSGMYLRNNNEYKRVLNYLFEDANMGNEIGSSTLQQGSMIELTKKYHEKVCKDSQCIIYRKSLNHAKTSIGIVYGINSMLFNLKSNTFNQAMGVYYSNLSNSYLGLTFNFHNLPLIHERYSINLELLATKFNYRLDDYYRSSRKYYIKVPLTIQYKILPGRLCPIAEVGVVDDIVSYNQQHFTYIVGGEIDLKYFRNFGFYIGARVEEFKRFSVRSGLYF